MGDEEPFFVARNGAVWACWLSGRPALNLGPEAQVLATMAQFLAERGAPAAAPVALPPATSAAPPPPPTPPPVAAPPAPPPEAARPKLERTSERHDLTIIGKLYTATGSRDVTILDLSESGCRFHDRFGQLQPETPVTIKIGPIGPVAATVKWCRKEYVGLEFNSPLYPSVLEHIRSHFDLRR